MYNDYPTIYESVINHNLIYIIILITICLILLIISFISLSKVFKKANRSGISAIIPIYNLIVLLEITNYPKWYFVLLLIPGVNIVIYFIIVFKLAKLFKKSNAFALGIIFLPFIFLTILAFNDSEYIGINLVAMEGKDTVVNIPVIDSNEVESTPTVNDSYDDSIKNVNISIGGGVYQRNYTNNLLQVDEKQAIYNDNKNVNEANKRENIISTPTFISPVSIKEDVVTSSMNQNHSNQDQSFIKFPDPVVTNDNSQVNMVNNSISNDYIKMPNEIPSNVQNNVLNITNTQEQSNNTNFNSVNHGSNSDYISCPKCGARIKSDAKVCFLCGRRLD